MNADLYEQIQKELETKKNEEQKIIDNNKQEITMLDIELLDPFKNHIFSPLSEDVFNVLKESIKMDGVRNAIIVRKKEDRYEIISGHNRVKCCKELGISEIPAIIKNYNDDEAEFVMIDMNLAQRRDLLPCEKALAYKKRLEYIKKLRKENRLKDNNSNALGENTQIEQEGNSIEILAKDSNESRATIQRLIRLTELSDVLKRKVNDGVIGIQAGIELSYLNQNEQECISNYIDERNANISIKQAEKLRAVKGTITAQSIDSIINSKSKSKVIKFTGRLNNEITKKYKSKFANDKEFSELIDFLLEEYYKKTADE